MGTKRTPACAARASAGHRPLAEAVRVRVAYADTDAMGVAWHGSYLRWFEMARSELMRHTGLPYTALIARGLNLPAVEALVRYRKPARYDDLLIVRVAVSRPGAVRLRIDYRIERDAELIVEGHTVHAFTDAEGRVLRPPRDVQAVLDALVAAHGG